jgi:hypothetical protein
MTFVMFWEKDEKFFLTRISRISGLKILSRMARISLMMAHTDLRNFADRSQNKEPQIRHACPPGWGGRGALIIMERKSRRWGG